MARFKSGAIIFFCTVGVLIFGRWFTAIALACLFFYGCKECISFFKECKINMLETPLKIAILSCFFCAAISFKALYIAMIISIIVLLSIFIYKSFKEQILYNLADLSSNIFCLIYTGFLPAHFVLLRYLNDGDFYSSLLLYNLISDAIPILTNNYIKFKNILLPIENCIFERGVYYCLLTISSVFVNDLCAYYFGKNLGKTPLIKIISPKKTLEGSIAGIIGGTFIFAFFGMLCAYIFKITSLNFFNIFNWLQMIFFGICLNIIAQIGDLVESLMKRYVNLKDSGQIIEGHGGILDRFDSHIFVFPLAYLIFTYIIK